MDVQPILTGILLLLGFGFLIANVRILLEFLTYLRRRRAGQLLTWPSAAPSASVNA